MPENPETSREDEFNPDGPVICDTCHHSYTPSGELMPDDEQLAEIVDAVPDCPRCRARFIKQLGLENEPDGDSPPYDTE